jgi:hypothetical protein
VIERPAVVVLGDRLVELEHLAAVEDLGDVRLRDVPVDHALPDPVQVGRGVDPLLAHALQVEGQPLFGRGGPAA